MGNLAQLSAIKARLGLTDATDDTLLTNFIALISGLFEQKLRRKLDRQANVAEEFDAHSTELRVQRYPLEAVASFHLKTDETEGWVAQTDVEYLIRASSQGVPCVVTLATPIGDALQRIKITYTGGYVLPGTSPGAGQTALPSEIEQACIEQVAWLYQNRERAGANSVSGEGAALSLRPDDLLPQVRETLRPYERWAM